MVTSSRSTSLQRTNNNTDDHSTTTVGAAAAGTTGAGGAGARGSSNDQSGDYSGNALSPHDPFNLVGLSTSTSAVAGQSAHSTANPSSASSSQHNTKQSSSSSDIVYTIQLFPHSYTLPDGPRVMLGYPFNPIERDLVPGSRLKIGRRLEPATSSAAPSQSVVSPPASYKPASQTQNPSSRSKSVDQARASINNSFKKAFPTFGNSPRSTPQASDSSTTHSSQRKSMEKNSQAATMRRVKSNSEGQNEIIEEAGSSQSQQEPPQNSGCQSAPSRAMSPIKLAADAENDPVPITQQQRATTFSLPKVIKPQSPVVFQSRVVSRDHAEIFVTFGGKIMIKDLGSSAGTFVNKVRLAPTDGESLPVALKTGDVVQLGVDYRKQPGNDDSYKAVVIKFFATKRSAQPNPSQLIQPQRLRIGLRALLSAMNPTAGVTAEASTTDCVICLNKLSPQQALFLAPCSHCFHFPCAQPLFNAALFQCPICRQPTNLHRDPAATAEDDVSENDVLDERLESVESWLKSVVQAEFPSTAGISDLGKGKGPAAANVTSLEPLLSPSATIGPVVSPIDMDFETPRELPEPALSSTLLLTPPTSPVPPQPTTTNVPLKPILITPASASSKQTSPSPATTSTTRTTTTASLPATPPRVAPASAPISGAPLPQVKPLAHSPIVRFPPHRSYSDVNGKSIKESGIMPLNASPADAYVSSGSLARGSGSMEARIERRGVSLDITRTEDMTSGGGGQTRKNKFWRRRW